MKTIKCDICGRTEDDLIMYEDRKMYRFKATFRERNTDCIKKFDVCARCLNKIKKSVGESKKDDCANLPAW